MNFEGDKTIMKWALRALLLFVATLIVTEKAFSLSSEGRTLINNAVVTSTSDSNVLCLPRLADDFVFYLKTVNNAGTNPTMAVKIQHSDDETNWFDYETFTGATSGTFTELKQEDSTNKHMLRCIKAVSTIGGTNSPSYNVTVKVYFRVRN